MMQLWPPVHPYRIVPSLHARWLLCVRCCAWQKSERVAGTQVSEQCKSAIQDTSHPCFGVSTHVLAILHQSGTSPEALAELAGIAAPSLRHKDSRGSDRSEGSADKWDVAPGVCWADKGAGQTPASNMKDPEGYSQLPPSASSNRLNGVAEVSVLQPAASGQCCIPCYSPSCLRPCGEGGSQR